MQYTTTDVITDTGSLKVTIYTYPGLIHKVGSSTTSIVFTSVLELPTPLVFFY